MSNHPSSKIVIITPLFVYGSSTLLLLSAIHLILFLKNVNCLEINYANHGVVCTGEVFDSKYEKFMLTVIMLSNLELNERWALIHLDRLYTVTFRKRCEQITVIFFWKGGK